MVLNHEQAGQRLARLLVIHAPGSGYGSVPKNDDPLNEMLDACNDLAKNVVLTIDPPLTVTWARGAQIIPCTAFESTVSVSAW